MSGQTPESQDRDGEAGEAKAMADVASPDAGGPATAEDASGSEAGAGAGQHSAAADELPSDAASPAATAGASAPADPAPPSDMEPTPGPDPAPSTQPTLDAKRVSPSLDPPSGQDAPQRKSRIGQWIRSKPHQFVITTIVAVVALVIGSIPGYIALFRDASPAPAVATNTNIFMPTVDGAEGQAVPATQKGCQETMDNKPGWGPTRPTVAGPIALTWPSLNADRENPNVGDERNFFRIKDADNHLPGGQSNTIDDVQIGKRYLVQLYIHNSGAIGDFTVARDVKIKVNLPNCASRRISSYGFLTSSTAFPSTVWCGVTLSSSTPFALAYVPDTARLLTNANPNPGIPVPGTDFLSGTGQLVGYDKLDGVMRGGYQQSAYFTFIIEAVRPA